MTAESGESLHRIISEARRKAREEYQPSRSALDVWARMNRRVRKREHVGREDSVARERQDVVQGLCRVAESDPEVRARFVRYGGDLGDLSEFLQHAFSARYFNAQAHGARVSNDRYNYFDLKHKALLGLIGLRNRGVSCISAGIQRRPDDKSLERATVLVEVNAIVKGLYHAPYGSFCRSLRYHYNRVGLEEFVQGWDFDVVRGVSVSGTGYWLPKT